MVTRSLRADEPWTAPADEIAVGVTQRTPSPIATRAGSWIWSTVSLVYDVAGRGSVCRISASTVGDRAADDGAADHARCNARADRTAIAACFGGGRGTQATRCQDGGGRKREDRLLHRSSLQVRSAVPTAKSSLSESSPRAEIETVPICRKFVERRPAPRSKKSPDTLTESGLSILHAIVCPIWLAVNRRPARDARASPNRPRRADASSSNHRIHMRDPRRSSPDRVRNTDRLRLRR